MSPSGALAGAAVSAGALALAIDAAVRGLPLAPGVASDVRSRLARVERVLAPRIRSTADVAAIGVALVTAVQSAARDAQPGDASAILYATAARARACVPVSASPILTRGYALARALSAAVETACLGEAFLAEARTAFVDRRAATEARQRITSAIDEATDRIAAALGQELQGVLSRLARETSAHLVRVATSLQPIVRVEAGRSYPSTALAWSLYGDPARAEDLVLRNRVGTPLFMPASVEAVSPAAA